MHIRVSQSGGYAGIPIALGEVDTAALPAAEGARVERLVRDAGFFELPARVERGAGEVGADTDLRYEITAEEAGRRHTVSFADDGGGGAASAPLRALVAAVTAGR